MPPREDKTSGSPSLWHNRNYLLLQSGQIVSSIGDQQQFIALPLLVLALTGSAIQAGIAVSVSTIAVLVVSPLAGALVDRWNRKKTMLLCDSGRLLLLFSIPLAFWFHILTIVQILLVVSLAGGLGTIFSVANVATLPDLVTQEQLPDALAQSQMAFTGIRTLGSSLGSVLYSIGSVFPFLVNALSFGASVLSLSFIKGHFQSDRTDTGQPLYKTIAEGFSWLWKQPLLRFLLLVNGADRLRYGAGYLVILILAEQLHTPTGEIGAIFTAAAIGALLGNLVSNRVRRHWRFGTITISMLWLEAVMFPLYAIAPNALAMCFIAAAEEFVNPIYTVSLTTYQLTATPDFLRGRMSSTTLWVLQGAQSLGAIVGGILIQEVGAKGSALLLGAWLLFFALATTLNRQVRQASSPSGSARQDL